MSSNWFGIVAVAGGIGLVALAASPDRAPLDGAMEPTRLEVNLSEREMYLYHDGERVKTYAVAVGEPEHPTPTGRFDIDRVEWNPDWVPPNTGWAKDKERKEPNDPDNPMVGAKLFFSYPDYYIHGTDAVHTLGDAESHGCIRMEPSEVLDLAEWVQQHGGEKRGDGWYAEARENDGSTSIVKLPDAVPVHIHE